MLQIRKKAEDVFKHYNEQGTFLLSRGYFKIDNGVFFIVEAGGARRNLYPISEITVYDDTDSGTPETFTTDVELYERLVELRYNLVETSSGGFVSDLTSSPQDYPFVDTNTFVLPDNYVIVSVHTNDGTLLRKTQYNKSGNNLLIIDFLEVGDIVEVRGVVAIGSFGTGGGGGGSSSWGSITGNLSDQTDLKNALDLKQDKPIIISANKIAVVNEVYNNISNVIYTDPTSPAPVNGDIYTINILSGTATIGGVGYTSGKLIRSFNGTLWSSNHINTKGLVWNKSLIVNLPVTGTTAKTHVYTVEMPKIHLEGSGSVMIEVRDRKSATAVTARTYASINTIDSVTGEQEIAISESAATTTSLNPSMQRTIIFDPTTIQHVNAVVTATDFSSANNVAHQITATSIKDNNFLRIYVLNGSTSVTTTVLGITVRIYNND